ncbi:tetratricopeptide repeat protein [Nocardia sp. NBC_01503]|uniref:ATP-binding protein n=1 Tax=Nocardia sp. NBC_01503 TaxID=2975997 RepID=UPI002E7B07CB|nr:tetratricopeptide repeat protein [Nocardia sp. NBC_01503]WTL29337.1 tetratricopeptide repeat protein [Nocardia sp. NBC_01503]
MVSGSANDEGGSPRTMFGARLTELWALAGNPTLRRVVTASEARMRPATGHGSGTRITVQRISDWRAGRNLPVRFEAFAPVLLTLLTLAGNQVPAELADRRAWRRLWNAARETTPDTGAGKSARTGDRTDGGDSEQRPRITNALRRDIETFTGREAELQRLVDSAQPGRVLAVHTVDGMPGIGKTTLVTHAAHLLAEKFPDGRYFVELNTHTAGQSPAEPADVLARLLTDLGIDARHLPDTLVGRRDLWRDRLADKRVLLILDDAGTHDQIEPLLPSAPGCLTLITSRRRLIALDGAVPLSLDVLDPSTAVDLFCRSAHRATTTESDYAAIAEIVRLCGYLPLAIVLLAGRLAHHPTWSVTDLAREFNTAHDRLDELDTGHHAVRAAFTTSYSALPPDRQRLFRRLGLHPGTDFDAYAAAALADIPRLAARRGLEALYTDHLIDEIAPGRYRFHDLVREYAVGVAADETAEDRARAVDRLLDYYRDTANAAAVPSAPAASPDEASSPVVQTFPDFTTALAWIRRERSNLLAGLEYAGAANHLARVVALTDALTSEMRLIGAAAPAVAIVQRALVAPDTIADRHASAFAFKDLGATWYFHEDYVRAAAVVQRVLEVSADSVDAETRAAAWRTLGRVRYLSGSYALSGAALEQARQLYRAAGRSREEVSVLSTLGWVTHLTGEYLTAAEMLRECLTRYEELGSPFGSAGTLVKLGWVNFLLDDAATAVEQLLMGQQIFLAGNQPAGAASAMETLAWIRVISGDTRGSMDLLEQALHCHRQIGSLSGQAFVLNNLGFGMYDLEDHDAADAYLEQALELYRTIGNRAGEASVFSNLGLVRQAMGELEAAEEVLRRALTINSEIGNVHGVTEAQERLWALGSHTETSA